MIVILFHPCAEHLLSDAALQKWVGISVHGRRVEFLGDKETTFGVELVADADLP